ncbi:MAG: hypothetical protein IKJ63_00785 [Clostridia bacterium]|nr:hypothetical protein [Clostridia bacterium]MBR2415010.1 hypothetical protein [Clostridia bacterium]MBR3953992.1 hypothetical protein [Clostridia bacterium]
MHNERERSAELMRGDRSDYNDRQILRLLEEIRADVRALRALAKEET